MNAQPEAVQRTGERIAALIRHLTFEPDFLAVLLKQGRIFGHSRRYFVPDAEVYGKLITRLRDRYPTVAEETIEQHCNATVQMLLDEIVDTHNFEWDNAFTLGDTQSDLVDQDRLLSAAENLLSDLASLVRDYMVFVPLMGVELSIPEYDFCMVLANTAS